MPTTVPEPRQKVVVGLLVNPAGEYLVQQRRPGTPCAGQWEFPGGKIENGESPSSALEREFHEELGIRIKGSSPFALIEKDYAHAKVELDVHLITSYSGNPFGREGQVVCWLHPERIVALDVLKAVHDILARLPGDDGVDQALAVKIR